MAEKKLNARVRYSKTQDAFVIEIQDTDDSWTLCAVYQCHKAEGLSDETDHIHFSIVNQILEMVAMGYHIYKSDVVD